MNVLFEPNDHDPVVLLNSIEALLSSNELAAMATVDGGRSHIFTAYFCYDDDLNFYFLSQPTDRHAAHLKKNRSISVAVWNRTIKWGSDLQGIQVFGECEEVSARIELAKAMKLFMMRFKAFSSIVENPGIFIEGITSKVFRVTPSSIKLLDEPNFGRRNYIALRIKAQD